MRFAVRHWDGLILHLDDGHLEMDTNIVERAMAIANTLIQSCKLNGVGPV
jgi:hypothetical protein